MTSNTQQLFLNHQITKVHLDLLPPPPRAPASATADPQAERPSAQEKPKSAPTCVLTQPNHLPLFVSTANPFLT